MLEELAGNVFVDMIVFREFERDAHEIQRIHRHPAGAVGLIEIAAGGQLRAAVKYADIVEP